MTLLTRHSSHRQAPLLDFVLPPLPAAKLPHPRLQAAQAPAAGSRVLRQAPPGQGLHPRRLAAPHRRCAHGAPRTIWPSPAAQHREDARRWRARHERRRCRPGRRGCEDGERHGGLRGQGEPREGPRWWAAVGEEELGEGFPWWMGRWADEVGEGLVLTSSQCCSPHRYNWASP